MSTRACKCLKRTLQPLSTHFRVDVPLDVVNRDITYPRQRALPGLYPKVIRLGPIAPTQTRTGCFLPAQARGLLHMNLLISASSRALCLGRRSRGLACVRATFTLNTMASNTPVVISPPIMDFVHASGQSGWGDSQWRMIRLPPSFSFKLRPELRCRYQRSRRILQTDNWPKLSRPGLVNISSSRCNEKPILSRRSRDTQ